MKSWHSPTLKKTRRTECPRLEGRPHPEFQCMSVLKLTLVVLLQVTVAHQVGVQNMTVCIFMTCPEGVKIFRPIHLYNPGVLATTKTFLQACEKYQMFTQLSSNPHLCHTHRSPTHSEPPQDSHRGTGCWSSSCCGSLDCILRVLLPASCSSGGIAGT